MYVGHSSDFIYLGLKKNYVRSLCSDFFQISSTIFISMSTRTPFVFGQSLYEISTLCGAALWLVYTISMIYRDKFLHISKVEIVDKGSLNKVK